MGEDSGDVVSNAKTCCAWRLVRPVMEDVRQRKSLGRGGKLQTRRDPNISPIRRDHFAVLQDFNQELNLFFQWDARQQPVYLATTSTHTPRTMSVDRAMTA
jgi:hypothetical protein